jgi:hypothetical protein
MNPSTSTQSTAKQESRKPLPGKDYTGCTVRPDAKGELKWHNIKGQAFDLVSDEEALEILG